MGRTEKIQVSMNATTLENKINSYIAEHSNFDERRDYLGISHVSGCQRRAYTNYINGMSIDENTRRMSFAGYEQEQSIRTMLNGVIHDNGKEVIAGFDKRLRGHVDGVTVDYDLIEIKSVTVKKFQKIIETGKALHEHFAQCQLYMRYGSIQKGFIIYRCRETYEHKVFQIPYLEQIAEKLEEKARRILTAIDSKTPPPCECGYCK
jgi:hypothetical protein